MNPIKITKGAIMESAYHVSNFFSNINAMRTLSDNPQLLNKALQVKSQGDIVISKTLELTPSQLTNGTPEAIEMVRNGLMNSNVIVSHALQDFKSNPGFETAQIFIDKAELSIKVSNFVNEHVATGVNHFVTVSQAQMLDTSSVVNQGMTVYTAISSILGG